jgi:hypothetical protein
VVGLMLDLFGSDTIIGWSIGFRPAAIVTLLALWMLRRLAEPVGNSVCGA